MPRNDAAPAPATMPAPAVEPKLDVPIADFGRPDIWRQFAHLTGHPVDSEQGLRDSGLDPREFGSCARPRKDELMGCANYNKCQFVKQRKNVHPQLNRSTGQTEPRERPIIIAEGTIEQRRGIKNVGIMSCWDWHRTTCRADGIRENFEKSGIRSAVIGHEGDVVPVRARIKTHRIKDPLCEGCRNGACTLHEEKERPTIVPRFACISEQIGSLSTAEFAATLDADEARAQAGDDSFMRHVFKAPDGPPAA